MENLVNMSFLCFQMDNGDTLSYNMLMYVWCSINFFNIKQAIISDK